MFSKQATLIATLVLLIPSLAWAMRSKKPQTFTNLQDTNQLTELNTTLADLWDITNGRYTLENITTNPQDTRKGVKGDLVYATFGGNDHLCVSTSFPEGKDWTCVNVGTLSTCPGGADTQVQFNDNGDCGGDISFIFDKNVNHASLGPDAEIDKSFTPDVEAIPGSAAKLLTLSDVRNDWGDGNFSGVAVEFKATPVGGEGFGSDILSGYESRMIIDGTAGAGGFADLLSADHFNAFTSIRSAAADDDVDSLIPTPYRAHTTISLTGTGTNTIGDLIQISMEDWIKVTADSIDTATFYAHWQDIDLDVPVITSFIQSGFFAGTDLNATTSLESIVASSFESNITMTSPTIGTATNVHFLADSLLTFSSTSGTNGITDFGYAYEFDVDGSSLEGVVSAAFSSDQSFQIEPSGACPTFTEIAGVLVPNCSGFGLFTRQTIDALNDSGTFITLRGGDLAQTWSGDVNGTNVDGILITGLAKAGSGTVTTATNLNLITPVRTAGTLTNAFTIQLTVPTTGGTENAGIRFADGLSNLIEFEGNTANGFETRLSIVEPTADNIITLPNQIGTIVLLDSSSTVTVTGQVVVDSAAGTGQMTLDGATGGCVMLRDTDDAGWTECDALDGTLTCSIDVDGVCD